MALTHEHGATLQRLRSVISAPKAEAYFELSPAAEAAGVPPFVADLGLGMSRRVRLINGQREVLRAMTIEDMGDLRTFGALTTIDGSGMTVVPLGDEPMDTGRMVDLPEWRSKLPSTIAVGQPARFLLLKPALEPGKYVVQAVMR